MVGGGLQVQYSGAGAGGGIAICCVKGGPSYSISLWENDFFRYHREHTLIYISI